MPELPRETSSKSLIKLVATASVLTLTVYLTEQFKLLRRRLSVEKAELALALKSVQSLAFRDELTKLPNRRFMQDLLVAEERRHAQEKSSCCVALLDIDYFKQVNDKSGHQVGDQTLTAFAEVLNGALRAGDVLARWGGEEFLLLLPDTDPTTAIAILKRLQATVDDALLRVTFSAGLAVVSPGQSIIEAVNFADKAMFQAKAAGRHAIKQYIDGADVDPEKVIDFERWDWLAPPEPAEYPIMCSTN